MSEITGLSGLDDAGKQMEGARTQPTRGDLAWAGEHAIDIRATVPIKRRRFYVVILAGRERGIQTRLHGDVQRVWWRTALVYVLLASQIVALMVGWTVIAYIIKCYFRINLMAQSSPLHFLYEMLFT